ncbi:MAG: hypothetical protein GY711_34940 [bacterium]|nr:hypothetical protein [bacterium]
MARLLALLAFVFGGVAWVAGEPAPAARSRAEIEAGSEGCLKCHEGIEPMHPEAQLSCVDCHGGDATVRQKLVV